MILNVIFIVLGIVLVLWGADRLTEGAVAVAEKLKVPQIVIGLTIVAVGTSMPEFCVSLVSAIKGTPDLAVGNVVGSNIFNTLLIVGVAAVIAPITILPSTVKKDIPFALVASALLMMLGYDGNLSRIDAVVLLIMFAAFMYITLKAPSKLPQEGHGHAYLLVEGRLVVEACREAKCPVGVAVGDEAGVEARADEKFLVERPVAQAHAAVDVDEAVRCVEAEVVLEVAAEACRLQVVG